MNWLRPSVFGERGNRTHHGYQISRDPAGEWLDGFDDVLQYRWSKLNPGGFALPHIDVGPHRRRWHVPVQPAGVWWDPVRGAMHAPTEPYEVRHHEPHALWNADDIPRIIICVDLVEVVSTALDFELCPWDPEQFPELAELVSGVT